MTSPDDDGVIWPAPLAEWNPRHHKRSEWHYARWHSIRRYGQQYNDPRPDIEERELAAARAFQDSEISQDQEARLRGQDRMMADLGITSGDLDDVRLLIESERRESQRQIEKLQADNDRLVRKVVELSEQIDGGRTARRWLGRSK